jgi:hypothetical protein
MCNGFFLSKKQSALEARYKPGDLMRQIFTRTKINNHKEQDMLWPAMSPPIKLVEIDQIESDMRKEI